MTQHSNTKFAKSSVQISGHSFIGCTFEYCEMVFTGEGKTTLGNCTFIGCSWRFDGPALATAEFMSAMYAAGGAQRELIENTMRLIKGEIKPPLRS